MSSSVYFLFYNQKMFVLIFLSKLGFFFTITFSIECEFKKYYFLRISSEHHILLLTFSRCSIIAIGNGTACRKTEEWISSLICSNFFAPLDVKYIIVSEEGASIYSCSVEAQKEFGNLDPNIISAGNNFVSFRV